jgi:hypothetical protein
MKHHCKRSYALTKTIGEPREPRLHYGENSELCASSYPPYLTARYRNGLMSGHKA